MRSAPARGPAAGRHGPPTSARTGASVGFTLVELLVVIVIVGIVSSVLGLFVTSPIRGFIDQSRRAALTDAADLALLRMSRDLRSALPNSVRTSGDGSAIELLRTLDGERYRIEPPGGEDDRLTPGAADSAFNTLAPLGGGEGIPASARLAIYPLGDTGTNPWTDPVMTPAGTSITRTAVNVAGGASESRLTLSPAHAFPRDSPSRRVFLVEGPVSYLCADGLLLRYERYAVQANQPTTRSALNALATPTVIAEGVSECSLRYFTGTSGSAATDLNSRRNAVARLAVVLELQDEPVSLQRQVHIDNSP